MLFNSPEFIFLFLPITLIIFYLLGRLGHFRTAISWLVLASLFYYGYWNPAYLWLIIGSMLVNYSIGVKLSGYTHPGKLKNVVLGVGIVLNLGLLGYYKYANFFVDTLNDVGITHIHLESIILPLAISFFTFQQIAYLVDAWKGEAREYNFLHYCLFVVFFPQLIAGPIVHHKEIIPQFMRKETYGFSHFNLALGLSIFFVGLFKKIIIADNLAPWATPIFEAAQAGETLHLFQVCQGVMAYTFQLYFDFSGYSDMAIGLGRMFGILIPLNFNSPYKAVNIIDFWRRWHMTLSRFLRDYIYIPLGGNRKGKTRRYANLMITMLLGGLWHGAGWTFIFWGFLHGLYLVINHAWHRIWKVPINKWWSIGIARLVTLIAVMLAWVFFRAGSFEGALNILRGMMNLPFNLEDELSMFSGILVAMGFEFSGARILVDDTPALVILFGLLVAVWILPNTQQIFAHYQPAYNDERETLEPTPLQRIFPLLFWRPSVAWSIWIGLLGGLCLLSLSQVSEFLYYDF